MVEYLERILIKRCQNGEKDAFLPLIQLYREHLFSYLYRRCIDRETAEDLFQETLIKVWKNIRKYKEMEKFGSWLYSVAHNVSVDEFRKRKVRNTIPIPEELEDNRDGNDFVHRIEMNEEKKVLINSLSQLSEKQREVFLLRQHGDMTFREISELLNQPLNTVLSHMNYAVKKLKEMMRKEYAE